MWWNSYMRIPFCEKGRDHNGVDCWGLVRLIYREQLGIDLPDYLECYEKTTDRDILASTIRAERESLWHSPAKPQAFDVIIVNMRGVPMHVGVVTRPGHMIHTAKDVNTCHERYDSTRWECKVEGFARHQRLLIPSAV